MKGGFSLRFIKCEKGWVTVYFAILLPVFLLFSALGMDYGRAFVLKHQLQSACDAASLAGASAVAVKLETNAIGQSTGKEILIIDPFIAESRASDIWNQNFISLKFAEKGVTIIDKTDHYAFDQDDDGYDDTYRWGVTAKIETVLAGQLAGTGKEIVVRSAAESWARNPNP